MTTQTQETGVRKPSHENAKPCRILVIEDNADARESLRTLLELWGHEVFESEGGQSSIDVALALMPDVALIDIGLPVIGGYEIAQRIRATPGGRGIFLVALTGYGQPEDRRRAYEAGFNLHLVKPVNFDELSEVLAAVSAPN